jgi:hypothetical protein
MSMGRRSGAVTKSGYTVYVSASLFARCMTLFDQNTIERVARRRV